MFQTSETKYDNIVLAASVLILFSKYFLLLQLCNFQVSIQYLFQVEKTECRNCLIWSKSDNLARDVVKLSSEIAVRSSLFSFICKTFSCFTCGNFLSSCVMVFHLLLWLFFRPHFNLKWQGKRNVVMYLIDWQGNIRTKKLYTAFGCNILTYTPT